MPTHRYTVTAHHRGRGIYLFEVEMWFLGECVKGVDVSRLTPRALELWNEEGASQEKLDKIAIERRLPTRQRVDWRDFLSRQVFLLPMKYKLPWKYKRLKKYK